MRDKLKNQFQYTDNKDLEKKIMLLYALSYSNDADFSFVNRIYRSRENLSVRGLALLGLTFLNIDRKAEAKDVATSLLAKLPSLKAPIVDELDWYSNESTIKAMSYILISKTLGIDKKTENSIVELVPLIDNFVIYKCYIYPPYDINFDFLAFLSELYYNYMDIKGPSLGNFTLTIKANDDTLLNDKKVIFKDRAPITYSIDKLKKRNAISFKMDGDGSIPYQIVASYFKKGEVKENVKDKGYLEKKYDYPQYSIEDKTFYRGQSILFENIDYKEPELSEVSQHQMFPVQLKLAIDYPKEKYFILQDYIPAGCDVVDNTITGDFEYYKREGNSIIFYINATVNSQNYKYIKYNLIPRYIGEYKVFPPIAYPIRDIGREIRGPIKELKVHDSKYDTFSKYTFSPDEKYNLALFYFDKKDYKKCENFLKDLISYDKLRDNYYKEVLRMYLTISIVNNNDADIVKYSELLRERYPTLTIPFEDIIRIADAYSNIKEYERACQVIEGAYRGYFYQESVIAGTLIRYQKTTESFSFMEDLFKAYPDLNIVKTTYYSYGQELYLQLTEMTADPKNPRWEGLTKDFLYKKAMYIFSRYLSIYPETSNCDEVSFTVLNLFLDANKPKQCYIAASVFSERYPKSQFLDSFKYVGGYAYFAKKMFDEAEKWFNSVAYDKFPDTNGELKESENKNFAIHMLAKIYHSQAKYLKALELYKEVSNDFLDAKRSVDFLEERKLLVDEVTQIAKDEEAKIELKYKGLLELNLKVYKVDFIMLALKEKDLSKITNVKLSGIKPTLEKTVILHRTKQYTPQTKELPLPIEEVGAYLLVFKGEDVESSAILIKSDLKVDMLEADAGGKIRVSILDKDKNYVPEVRMHFIDANGSNYVNLETDLRGIAEADGFYGSVSVIGEKDGHYCFYKRQYAIAPQYNYDEYRQDTPSQNFYLKGSIEIDSNLPFMKNIKSKRFKLQNKNRSYFNEQTNQERDGMELQELYK